MATSEVTKRASRAMIVDHNAALLKGVGHGLANWSVAYPLVAIRREVTLSWLPGLAYS